MPEVRLVDRRVWGRGASWLNILLPELFNHCRNNSISSGTNLTQVAVLITSRRTWSSSSLQWKALWNEVKVTIVNLKWIILVLLLLSSVPKIVHIKFYSDIDFKHCWALTFLFRVFDGGGHLTQMTTCQNQLFWKKLQRHYAAASYFSVHNSKPDLPDPPPYVDSRWGRSPLCLL